MRSPISLQSALRAIKICRVLFLLAAASQAQTLDEADQLLQSARWPEALRAFTSLAKEHPGDGKVWTGLGEAQIQTRDLAAAATSFKTAEQLGYRRVLNQVNQARVAALQSDSAKVYALFQGIVDDGNGGRARVAIAVSPEFQALSHQPRFVEFVKEKMAPCTKPEYRQFDFWLGDWTVQDTAGNVVGHNTVTSEQDGCLLVEHWRSGEGWQTGSSFNYFDIRDQKWHQLYIDNSGNAGAFPAMAGVFSEGKMTLYTDRGSSPLSRWIWEMVPGKGVRQMAEQSTDQGKTWQTFWDSMYVKQP